NYNNPHPLEYWPLQGADDAALNIRADRVEIFDYKHFVTLNKRLNRILLLIHFAMNSSSHLLRMRSAASALQPPGYPSEHRSLSPYLCLDIFVPTIFSCVALNSFGAEPQLACGL